jgi:glycerol-3-phosphate dehydrogenase (NAD(P)+)
MRTAVVGAGSWGTAFALMLTGEGRDTTLVCRDPEQAAAINAHRRNPRYLYDVALPDGLHATTLEQVDFADYELIALAVPSRAFAEVAASVCPRMDPAAAALSLTKGLDPGSARRLSELLGERLGEQRVAVLSGPNHAEEVARGFPTATVIAASDRALSRRLQEAVSGRVFRVYSSADVVGVELYGATKNVIALAAGVSDGLGFGDNARAALITRGAAEMFRLGECLGAATRTAVGMAGMGDLVATCTSSHSRNRRAGELLARGVPAGWIEAELGQVAEGLTTAPVLREMARGRGIELPITSAVCDVAFAGKTPLEALADLMRREPTEE